jgi:hypothetical protein
VVEGRHRPPAEVDDGAQRAQERARSALPAATAGLDAIIGSTNSEPGIDSSRNTRPTSPPNPPLLMRTIRSQN